MIFELIIKSFDLSIESLINVFKSPYQTRVIIFSALVGSLILLTQKSGGVDGFVNKLSEKKIGKTKKGAQLFSFFIGFVIFIESSITSLVAGAVSRPLFDRLKISREKLAYILDSTAAPICILIPINAWGGTVAGILSKQGIGNGFEEFIKTIPLNFYPIITILFCLFIIIKGKDFGPMSKAEKRVEKTGKIFKEGAVPLINKEITETKIKNGVLPKSKNLIIPILVMSISMPILLFITGKGNFFNGSGSKSVLYSVLIGIITSFIMYRKQKIFNTHEFFETSIRGAGGLISLSLILMLAFSIGNLCTLLSTGKYMAQAAQLGFGKTLIPVTLFIISALMSFAIGTSWGTWAIMIPIALPIINSTGAGLYLSLGAVLGGAVFGDHASPISDTTVVASLASASDHIDHVKTQLPYAITVAGISVVFYLFFGFML